MDLTANSFCEKLGSEFLVCLPNSFLTLMEYFKDKGGGRFRHSYHGGTSRIPSLAATSFLHQAASYVPLPAFGEKIYHGTATPIPFVSSMLLFAGRWKIWPTKPKTWPFTEKV